LSAASFPAEIIYYIISYIIVKALASRTLHSAKNAVAPNFDMHGTLPLITRSNRRSYCTPHESAFLSTATENGGRGLTETAW